VTVEEEKAVVTVEEEKAGDGGRGKSGGADRKVASGTVAPRNI